MNNLEQKNQKLKQLLPRCSYSSQFQLEKIKQYSSELFTRYPTLDAEIVPHSYF